MTYPRPMQEYDAVILAGGQASRMAGCNKLLQCFDQQQRQLDRLHQWLQPELKKLWINSHRDHAIYQAYDAELGIFADLDAGFLGPMAGMHSAWSYSQSDWILFVPCDLYHCPEHLFSAFRQTLSATPVKICYATFNHHALYPLCLMHRSVSPDLAQALNTGQRSLYRFFQQQHAQACHFLVEVGQPHSINAWSELPSFFVGDRLT